MKYLETIAAMIILCLLACSGSDGDHAAPDPGFQAKPQDMPGGKIVLGENNHEIQFDLSDGYLKGVVCDRVILVEDVEMIVFSSDKVGWKWENAPFGTLSDSGIVEIMGTANNDEGIWAAILWDGSACWFNTSQWEITGKPWVLTEDDLVRYGELKLPAIVFRDGQAVIDFGGNVLAGLIEYGIQPEQVKKIQWNSDKVGWLGKSSAYATLQEDDKGNLFVIIPKMPNNDKGTFSAELENGGRVWFNIEAWQYESNVSLDIDDGLVEYVMF